MMISKSLRYSKRVFPYSRAHEYPYSRAAVSLLSTDTRSTRTSPLTLVGAVVVVATLIQTQRRFHYNRYTVAATFISMLKLQGSSSHGYRGSTAIDGLL
jgi:hypothetical protein